MTDVLHVSRHNTRSCPWWFFIYLLLFLILRPACVVELTANRLAGVLVLACVRRYRSLLSTCHKPDVAAWFVLLLFLSIHHQATSNPHLHRTHYICVSPKTGQQQREREKKRKTQSDSHSSNIYLSLHPSQGFIPLQPTVWLMQTWLMWFFPPCLVARLLRHYTSKNARHCAVMNTNSTPCKKKPLALYWRFE